MAGIWALGLVGVLLPAFQSDASEVVQAENVPRIELFAQRSKSTRIQGGDWDDKTERLSLDIKVTNGELAKSHDDLTLRYWLIARSAVDSKTYRLVDRGEQKFSLSAKDPGRVFDYNTPEVVLRWDNTGAVFGEKYDAWMVALFNAEGELLIVKASKPALTRQLAKALDLKTGAFVTSDLDASTDPALRDSGTFR